MEPIHKDNALENQLTYDYVNFYHTDPMTITIINYYIIINIVIDSWHKAVPQLPLLEYCSIIVHLAVTQME